jgi:transcriptional regulator with XRE-family HTH domain
MSRGRREAAGTLGERLRAARRRLGMSQGELGAAAGLSQTAVSRLEHGGVAAPPREAVDRLAAALGVAPGWLLGTGEAATTRPATPAAGLAPGRAAGTEASGAGSRLQALAEYRELLDRWRRGEAQPGDPRRRRALRALLEQTGGVPGELRWRR